MDPPRRGGAVDCLGALTQLPRLTSKYTADDDDFMATIGSVLHGAYGDYYEQLLCLKRYKKLHPEDRLVLFFEGETRLRELSVFDLGFADEVHLASVIRDVRVDKFVQYQVRDIELREKVIEPNADYLRGLMDTETNHKPWKTMRQMNLHDPKNDVGLGEAGKARLPDCFRDNGIDREEFDKSLTVGFLWRHRSTVNGPVSSFLQRPVDEVRRTKSELLTALAKQYGAKIYVCGMNLKVTEENRTRVDAKFSDRKLDVDSPNVTYLRGLSWGLELEILSRCTFSIVMASGFSEALWIKAPGRVCLVDPPPHYVAKLVWNRMPLFDIKRPSELRFQVGGSHSAERVLRRLKKRRLLPS